MKKFLVIVESPSKAKTIEKILGKNYEVQASYGHVVDLPKSTLGIDIENGFIPKYKTIKGKGELLKKLKTKAKSSDIVYLASDLDREGEAIAWHISNYIKLPEKMKRIVFNEITATAIKNAIKKPREIDINLVDAQQTRRLLDRIVGYKISPLLWKTINRNASAGRVQSVTLKIICDLEDEIKSFVPKKYREFSVLLKNNIELKLSKIDGEKVDKIFDETFELKLPEYILATKVDIKKKTQRPPLVFKTSTMQQLAASYLGFSASKTMRIAQQLYEGLEIAGQTKGLITYMRTDSTRVSKEAQEQAAKYIEQNLGKEYVGKYFSKDKNAQDAHEGIRPSYMELEPDKISGYLSKDQNKLYNLIWRRFITSQIAAVKYDQLHIIANEANLEFSGTVNKITFDGYYKYQKSQEDIITQDLPDIKENDKLEIDKILTKDGITKAPARYTEATIIKKLETEGIGRPSTYASIIDTLLTREYVILEDKKLVPTNLGYDVKEELEEHFKNIMNIKFTANMENELDEIADGKKEWHKILKEYYNSLEKDIDKYENDINKLKELKVLTDVLDSSKKPMLLKTGIYGKYLISETNEEEKISLKGIEVPKEEIKQGYVKVKEKVEKLIEEKKGTLTDYEEDGVKFYQKLGRFGAYLESENYAEDKKRLTLSPLIRAKLKKGEIKVEDGLLHISQYILKEKEENERIIKQAGLCEKCSKPFIIKKGRFGKFLACSGYPECKNIKNIKKSK
ncbi:type I DNA topoisomerase [Sneathia sanguinegens]|uniref:type I DNA topoisomerase n=1 Tax=Sneathia sanguinegens TaxID=40543 RepID=UPI0023F88809|nr:type I DNA topoisomerase [Sneathia sanguinegens]MDU4652960.1 type I DNA topoisomerase [Sneathia sanguinegens]